MLLTENKFIFIIGLALVAFLVLLGFIFFVIYRNIKIRQEKELEILDTIIKTQNSEQNRIAEDLHDELAPMLSAIKLQMNNLKNLSEADRSSVELCSSRLDKSIEDIRLIARNLSHMMIANNGLVPSLEDSVSLFARHSNIKFETKFNIDEKIISDLIKSSLYKIVMELVNNTIKHSNSSKVELSIHQEAKSLHVQYADNGKKLNGEVKKGIGTSSLQNRLKLINATIIYQSKEFTDGSSYNFTVPVMEK